MEDGGAVIVAVIIWGSTGDLSAENGEGRRGEGQCENETVDQRSGYTYWDLARGGGPEETCRDVAVEI